jgi:hypothetical protein
MTQQQEMLAGGGFNNGSGGFATGSTCTTSGTYKASNKYLENIVVLAAGEQFPLFSDGKKTTWYALTPSANGSFDSVKVVAGTI